jgi:hypothetical protein
VRSGCGAPLCLLWKSLHAAKAVFCIITCSCLIPIVRRGIPCAVNSMHICLPSSFCP